MASRWAIAFVRAGSFDVVLDGTRRGCLEEASSFTRPGLEFRCRHADLCPRCVSLPSRFDPSAPSGSEQVLDRAGWAARTSATPRLAYVDRRMAVPRPGRPLRIGAMGARRIDGARAETRDPKRVDTTPRAGPTSTPSIAICRAIETDPSRAEALPIAPATLASPAPGSRTTSAATWACRRIST